MAREVKEYGVRKTEIIDTAQNLFLQKGYLDTSVRDIVNKVGIAKGTFYHYFSSKEQLMKEMVDRIIDQSVKIYSSIEESDEMTFLEKINSIFEKMWYWKMGNKELTVIKSFLQKNNSNNDIWLYLRKSSVQDLSPILAELIKGGVDNGDFINDYPLETAEIIINLILDLKVTIGRTLKDNRDKNIISELIQRKIEAYNYSIERIMGVEPGSIKIVIEKI